MTVRHMKIFVEVCKADGVTAAAAHLHLSQPAVSLAIKELEEYYGVRLFDRIAKRLRITSTGELLLRYASSIVAQFDELENVIRNWAALGRLRIGSSLTIGSMLMPDLAKSFMKEWSQIELKVVIDSTDVILGKLQANELDLALIEGIAGSSNLVAEAFLPDELTVVCSPTHPLATAGRIGLGGLRQEKILLRERGSGTRDLFDHAMAAQGVLIDPAWESSSTTALIHAAANGLGLSVVPLRLAKTFLDRHVVSLLTIDGVSLHREFYLVHQKGKYLPPAAVAFMDLCRAVAADHGDGSFFSLHTL
jgi:DNA-binding transcriptional LysR family regulator